MTSNSTKGISAALKELLKTASLNRSQGSVRFETGKSIVLDGREFRVSILIEEVADAHTDP